MLILIYHVEYVISLVTGIFDNLAVETSVKYNMPQDPIRISLSNRGDDFLREVSRVNPNLKNHIDLNRDFINLIYSMREKVVHGEGLSRMIAPIAANWSNFIRIDDNQIINNIGQCGDKSSEYRIITGWGVLRTNTNTYLDPFYFAKGVIGKLIPFADKYLRLLGFNKYSIIAEREEVFKKAMGYFRGNGLFNSSPKL